MPQDDETDPRQVLLIVSGPSGTGKTTVCGRLTEEFQPQLRRAVTATTRPPRHGERDGADYHFLGKADFMAKAEAGAFYEWAEVHGFRYGTLKSEIREKMGRGADLILNIDVQGAAAFRQAAGVEAWLSRRLAAVFILPASLDQIRRRLLARGTETTEEIGRRLAAAQSETAEWQHFDYAFKSRSKEEDFQRLRAIYLAEKTRVRRPRKTKEKK